MTRLLDIDDVSLRFRLVSERPKTLQEYLIGLVRGGSRTTTTDFWVLKHVSCRLDKGERLGIVGPNGSGKSTLLRVIAGVMRPTEGAVRVAGSIAPLIELGAGFDYELTGIENIYLNASIMGVPNRLIARRLDAIVDFSELGPFIHAPLRTYSSGMIARLAFSIAVEVQADLLLVDEVLSVGDEGFRMKSHRRIQDIIDRGTSLVFVSHSMSEVESLCHHALWLEQGSVRLFGPAGKVARHYLGHFGDGVFQDIGDDHPLKPHIDALFTEGIVTGITVNGKRYFNGEAALTRAELAVFLFRALKFGPGKPPAPVFEDVPETHWAAAAIGRLASEGLIGPAAGEGNRFRPEDLVTGHDLLQILSRIDPERAGAVELPSHPHEPLTRGRLAEPLCGFFGLAADSRAKHPTEETLT